MIVHDYPPNFAEIVEALGLPPRDVVFAYGDAIYSPHTAKLPGDVVVHERTHLQQQAGVGGPAEWWRLYLSDAAFRCGQEVEAYRAQVECFAGRPARRAALRHFAKVLASPMYRLPITAAQARSLLQTGTLPAMAVPS